MFTSNAFFVRLSQWLAAHVPVVISTALVASAVTGCVPKNGGYQPTYSSLPGTTRQEVYVFAVHPLHGPQTLFDVYQPLIDYLNARLENVQLRLEASASYAAFEEKLKARQPHFALPNPYQVLIAQEQGYKVFAKMGDDRDFRGLLLVRNDSGIGQPADLVGKAVSYPAPTALAATLLPQRWLHDHGVNVQRDLDNRYVGTQESSIMNVALATTAAGATWPQPWRSFQKNHPELASQLEVKWETKPLVNNALIARDDMPPDLVARIKALLVTLHQQPGGQVLLRHMEVQRFESANDDSFSGVRQFVESFSRDVRPIPSR